MSAQTGNKPQRWVWGALALTLGAAGWVAYQDSLEGGTATVGPAARSAAPQDAPRKPEHGAPAQAMPPLPEAYRPRPQIAGAPQNLFNGDPPPAPARAVSAPKPTMPPLPFKYEGRLVEDGNAIVFLTAGGRNLAARAGDVLNGTWRVEAIQPTAMTFTYLPLKSEATLAIGATN